MYAKIIAVAVLFAVVLVAGCGGDAAGPKPDAVSITTPQAAFGPDQDISLVGTQIWTVAGDTAEHPVQLVASEQDAIAFIRLEPGKWSAEALSSWQCDVNVLRDNEVVLTKHVVTTHVPMDKLEIMVTPATKITDTMFTMHATPGQPVQVHIDWIDHYNSGYPGWAGPPFIKCLWDDAPSGLTMRALDANAKGIEVVLQQAGYRELVGDVAGKKFTIRVQSD